MRKITIKVDYKMFHYTKTTILLYNVAKIIYHIQHGHAFVASHSRGRYFGPKFNEVEDSDRELLVVSVL